MRVLFPLSIAILMAVTTFSGCNRTPKDNRAPKDIRVSRLNAKKIAEEFVSTFPNRLPPFEEAPTIGLVGNLTELRSPQFLISNFPESEIPELIKWAIPLVKKLELDSLRLCYMKHDFSLGPNFIRGAALVIVYPDGTSEHQTDLRVEDAVPEPNFRGQPIDKIETANKSEMATPRKPSE